MTKFNPNDLTKNISDEVKDEARQEARGMVEDETAAFIKMCMSEGEDGKVKLIQSAALTLAVELHAHVSRLLNQGPDYCKPLDDMIKASGVSDFVIVGAFLGYGKTVVNDYFREAEELAKAGKSAQAIETAMRAKKLGTAGMAVADGITDPLLKAIKAISEGRPGSECHDGHSSVHLYPVPQKQSGSSTKH